MPTARRLVGDAGEDAVAAWYVAAGFTIAARNWRVREGELDIVARRPGVVVFCEVKTRRSDTFGIPAEAVTARKRSRIRGLATQWLAAAHMDVNALNRDCQVHVELDKFANENLRKTGKIVPIYFIYWQSLQNRKEGYGDVASVTLFAPTKTLMSLRVEDTKFILRPPLHFTNLNALLSKTN